MLTRLPRAADLRQRLTLHDPPDAVNAFGDVTQGPRAVATVWASVEAAGGREFDRAGAVEADSTHVVWLRFPRSFAVTPRMYFLWGARKLNVTSANDPEGRRRWLRCECKEATNAAAV